MSVRVPVSSEVGLFEFVQKICEYVVQPRICPFGTVWRKHAFTALGGKFERVRPDQKFQRMGNLKSRLEIRTASLCSSILIPPPKAYCHVGPSAKVPDPVSLLWQGGKIWVSDEKTPRGMRVEPAGTARVP